MRYGFMEAYGGLLTIRLVREATPFSPPEASMTSE